MEKQENNSIDKLFGSKTRAKLLRLFFSNINKSYYVREITRVIEEQINSVRRELINLENIGIVKSETYDNKVYYSANTKSPYSHAFQELFGYRVRTVSVTESSAHAKVTDDRWLDHIKLVDGYLTALIVTNRQPGQNGLDMLIIGDDRTKKLTSWAEIMEKKQGKPLNYAIMTPEDFAYRKSVRDRFVADVLEMQISEIYDPEKIIK